MQECGGVRQGDPSLLAGGSNRFGENKRPDICNNDWTASMLDAMSVMRPTKWHLLFNGAHKVQHLRFAFPSTMYVA